MKRTLNILGSLLMVGGIALLVYVGIAYVRNHQAATTKGWNAAEQKQGKKLASQLGKHQKIQVPKAKSQPPGSDPAIRMVIPKIGVNAPVVQTPPVNGVWQVADWAVGHLTTTPNPGVPGNSALAAHDDIEGEIFKRVDELRPGDKVLLYTQHTVYTYKVFNQEVVDPSNVSVLGQTAKPIITLISCTPYWVDTQRLVIQAALTSHAAA